MTETDASTPPAPGHGPEAVALPAIVAPSTALADHAGPPDGTPDDRLVELWLHGRSPHTVRAYRRALGALRAFTGGLPLRAITLGDLQAFADELAAGTAAGPAAGGAAGGRKPSSVAQALAAVKSLFSFGTRIGVLTWNVGAALRAPRGRDPLADRILGEPEVARMLALTTGRDHALIRLAYAGGFRVSELVALRWADLADAADGTLFVTVYGKGGKTRTVRVSRATADVLRALRDVAGSAYVFPGRGGPLNPSQAWRIVRAAARRAGLAKPVSPHFLRHAHASHALDRGAKLTTVRDTLGHSSIAITDRYMHARPEESSGLALPV